MVPKPKMNIRQGAGGSRAGGAGKPGYPLPDNLKNNLAVVDELVEDLIGKIASTGIVDKSDDQAMSNNAPAQLDLVVKKVLKDVLGEGGAAVKGDPVPRDLVLPTIERFRKEVLSKIPHTSAKPIGSTGKKSVSGDLDIGFDTKLSVEEVGKIVDDLGLENHASKGTGVVSVKFPQTDASGKENGKFAQVDLMIGPEDWIGFSYYAPDESESAYSGVHARALFIAMMNVVGGKSVSPARGFFTKGDKSKNKEYVRDPQKAVDVINAGSSQKWTIDDLNKPFEKIWAKAKLCFTPEQISSIKTYYKDFMKSVNKQVPKELEEAAEVGYDMQPDQWKKAQSRFKEKGNFLIKNADRLSKRNIDVMGAKKLGSGAYGNAYQLKNGDVLKLTTDESEAKASNSIKGKNTKHIVRVKDVFRFRDSRMFGVLQERLKELSANEKQRFDSAIKNVMHMVDPFEYYMQRSWQETKDIIEDSLTKEYDAQKDSEMISKTRKDVATLEDLGFGEVVDELFDNEIKYGDLHSGNLMRRNDGSLVIIDLGGESESPESKVDTVESKKLSEAEDKKGMPKGIQHLEDMKPRDFMAFLEKYRDLPLKSGLEVSEKVDGSAAITFGIENGKLWTQSKKGMRKTSSSQYGDKFMFKPLRMAHQALESKAKELSKAWPKDVAFMTGEVLYTKIPNTIEYGPNVLMIHGVQKIDGSTVSEVEARKLSDAVTSSVGEKLNDGEEDWKFEYKRIIPAEEVLVDVKNEYASLEEILARVKELEADKLKKTGKAAYKAAVDNFKAIQLAIKKKLLDQLRKQKSVYGPEGGAVEGIVFRDLESGDMTKLVDKDYFTKLNEFLWSFRNLLDRGNKVDGEMKLGVMQKFLQGVGEKVIGTQDIRLTTFVSKLKKLSAETKFPESADTKEKQADYVLSQYIKKNDLMSGDYLNSFESELEDAKNNFEKVKKEWDKKKKTNLKYDIKDDEGKTVKTVVMDKLIKDRTDSSFKMTEDLFNSMQTGFKKIQSMKGELTKKTALLKAIMGQNRFDKLVGSVDDEEDMNESAARENKITEAASVPEQLAIARKNVDRLLKKGYVLTNKILGAGSKGTAIGLEGDKVLKVTSDSDEATAALKVKGTNSKHIYKVFDVFKFGESNFFGIVQEKLEKIPGTAHSVETNTGAAALDKALTSSNLDYAIRFVGVPSGWNILYEVMQDEDKKYPRNNWEMSVKTLKSYNIPEMLNELAKLGIRFKDFHAGNIMKRSDGSYVLIDLGYSLVKNPGKIEVLEKKMNEATEQTLRDPIDVLNAFSEKLSKKNIDVSNAKDIGSGFNGMAFDLGNKVLKITEDATEARSSNHIKGKRLNHVLHVFDVFRFPAKSTTGGMHWYGILCEKLQPLKEEQKFSEALQICISNFTGQGDYGSVQNMWMTKPNGAASWNEVKSRVLKNSKDMGEGEDGADAIAYLEKIGFNKALAELQANHIEYGDIHVGNFMMRGNTLVVIDLGGDSKSPGGVPNVIERVQKGLREGKTDMIGVTIGRFHPFTKGHAAMIRELARRFSKVVVLIAGNNQTDPANPFSFELRKDMMKASLPDIFSKLEVHKTMVGYLPKVLSDLAINTSSVVEGDSGVTLLVGPDRFEEVKKQFERAAASKEQGKEESFFDPGLVKVDKLDPVKLAGEEERISGTRFREALLADDRETVKKMVDSHLVSNEPEFEKMYTRLKEELSGSKMGLSAAAKAQKPVSKVLAKKKVKKENIREATDSGMEEADIMDSLDANSEPLKKFGIDTNKLKRLGAGKDGVAFSIGNGKVLKVTTNADEARSSIKLSKLKQSEHVVHIFNVFRFKPDTVAGNKELFGIVTELLTKLDNNEKSEVDEISAMWLDPDVSKSTRKFVRDGNYPGLIKAINLVILQAEKQGDPINITEALGTTTAPARPNAFGKNVSTPTKPALKSTAAASTNNPRAEAERKTKILDTKYKKYNIPDMFKELSSAGIKFSDYHSDNLMKRGSTYVINDLGRSQGGLAGNAIPQLESLTSNIIDSLFESLYNNKSSSEIITENLVNQLISEIGAFTGLGSTGTGLRAGSSSVSSFKNRVDPNSEELWQNQLDRLKLKPGHPEEITQESNSLFEMMLEDMAGVKTADRDSDIFEKTVVKKINDRGGKMTAESMGTNPKMPDVKLTVDGSEEFVEVKMTKSAKKAGESGAQMGTPRVNFKGGKFVTAESPMAKALVSAMNDEANTGALPDDVHNSIAQQSQQFVSKLKEFVGSDNISLVSSRAELKGSRPKDYLDKFYLGEFFDSTSSTKNIFVVKNVDLTALVTSHYLSGKAKPAKFIQLQDDFYKFKTSEESSIRLKSGVPEFEMLGSVTARLAFSSSKNCYEIIITPKPSAGGIGKSKFSLIDSPGKEFPFEESN